MSLFKSSRVTALESDIKWLSGQMAEANMEVMRLKHRVGDLERAARSAAYLGERFDVICKHLGVRTTFVVPGKLDVEAFK